MSYSTSQVAFPDCAGGYHISLYPLLPALYIFSMFLLVCVTAHEIYVNTDLEENGIGEDYDPFNTINSAFASLVHEDGELIMVNGSNPITDFSGTEVIAK